MMFSGTRKSVVLLQAHLAAKSEVLDVVSKQLFEFPSLVYIFDNGGDRGRSSKFLSLLNVITREIVGYE